MSNNTPIAVQSGRAALLMMAGMMIIGYIDNFIIVIAEEISLWQFHATRSLIATVTYLGFAAFGLMQVRANNLRAVLWRSVSFALAMFIYFGCLAFLPISIVVAGLFTSPIVVMVITAIFLRQKVGPVRWSAAALGFVGLIFVINLFGSTFTPLAFLPVLAAIFYAISAIATRQWCEGETTGALMFWFLLTFGVMATFVMGVMALIAPQGSAGTDGFLTHMPNWPSLRVWFWVFVQAFFSMLAVSLITRAYQIGEASYVAVFEYSLMIFAPLWGWVIWQQQPTLSTVVGICFIIAAGTIIAMRTAGQKP